MGYDSLRREVKYGKNSRIDILLEGGKKPACYVEIKSVTLSRPEIGKKYLAEFKGSAYSYSEIDYSGTKKWEEVYSINYIWDFGLEFRMLNKGFPKDRINPRKRDNYLLAIDTKDKFDMENDENYFEFNRRK